MSESPRERQREGLSGRAVRPRSGGRPDGRVVGGRPEAQGAGRRGPTPGEDYGRGRAWCGVRRARALASLRRGSVHDAHLAHAAPGTNQAGTPVEAARRGRRRGSGSDGAPAGSGSDRDRRQSQLAAFAAVSSMVGASPSPIAAMITRALATSSTASRRGVWTDRLDQRTPAPTRRYGRPGAGRARRSSAAGR